MTAARAVLGLDTMARDLKAADAVLAALALPPGDVVGCTHLLRGDRAHIALTVEVDAEHAADAWESLRATADELAGGAAWDDRRHGADDAVRGALAAVAAYRAGTGRAVRFPGAERLTGVVTVADLLAGSAIERVSVLGGGEFGADTEVFTRDFVRPARDGGALVLALTPAAGGRLAPFEMPNPTPCGGDH